MDLQVLSEFAVLAETLSFQNAADRLHISHSTLTKHMQKLEKELGTELLSRTTRSVELSPYGQIYLERIRQMLAIHDQALSEIKQLHEETAHVLRMVFLPAPERYGLAELISGFQRAEPDIRIDLLDSDDARTMLLEGKCHLAIAIERTVDVPEIQRVLYKHDRLAVVLPESHPLAKAETVTIEQLRQERFILHRNFTGNIQSQEDLLKEICSRGGFTPNITQTVNFSSAIVRLVSRGEGVAVMNRLHVPTGISGVSIVDITPEVPFDICLCWRRDLKPTLAVQAFLDFFRSQYQAEL